MEKTSYLSAGRKRLEEFRKKQSQKSNPPRVSQPEILGQAKPGDAATTALSSSGKSPRKVDQAISAPPRVAGEGSGDGREELVIVDSTTSSTHSTVPPEVGIEDTVAEEAQAQGASLRHLLRSSLEKPAGQSHNVYIDIVSDRNHVSAEETEQRLPEKGIGRVEGIKRVQSSSSIETAGRPAPSAPRVRSESTLSTEQEGFHTPTGSPIGSDAGKGFAHGFQDPEGRSAKSSEVHSTEHHDEVSASPTVTDRGQLMRALPPIPSPQLEDLALLSSKEHDGSHKWLTRRQGPGQVVPGGSNEPSAGNSLVVSKSGGEVWPEKKDKYVERLEVKVSELQRRLSSVLDMQPRGWTQDAVQTEMERKSERIKFLEKELTLVKSEGAVGEGFGRLRLYTSGELRLAHSNSAPMIVDLVERHTTEMNELKRVLRERDERVSFLERDRQAALDKFKQEVKLEQDEETKRLFRMQADMQKAAVELTKQVSTAAQRYKRLEVDKFKLESDMAEKEAALEGERRRNERLEEEMAIVRGQYETMMETVAALQEARAKEVSQREALEISLAAAVKSLTERESQLESLQAVASEVKTLREENVTAGEGWRQAKSANEQNEGLVQQVLRLQGYVTSKEVEGEALVGRLNEAEAALSAKAMEVGGLTAHVEKLEDEFSKLSAEHNAVKEELNQTELRLGGVREKLSMAVKKGKEVVQQRDNLKLALAQKQAEIEGTVTSWHTESGNLRQELEKKQEALDAAVKQLEELEGSMTSLRDRAASDLSKMREDMQFKIDQKEVSVAELQAQLEDANRRLGFIQGLLVTSEEKIASLHKNVQESEGRTNLLKEEFTATVEELQRALSETQDKASSFETRLAAEEDNVRKLQEAERAKSSSLAGALHGLTLAEKQLVEATEKAQALQAKCSCLDSALKHAESQGALAVKEYETEMTRLHGLNTALEKKVQSLEACLSDADRKASVLEAETAEVRSRFSAVSIQADGAKNVANELERELTEARQKGRELSDELNDAKQELARLLEQATLDAANLANTEKMLREARNREQNFSREVDQTTRKLVDVMEKMSKSDRTAQLVSAEAQDLSEKLRQAELTAESCALEAEQWKAEARRLKNDLEKASSELSDAGQKIAAAVAERNSIDERVRDLEDMEKKLLAVSNAAQEQRGRADGLEGVLTLLNEEKKSLVNRLEMEAQRCEKALDDLHTLQLKLHDGRLREELLSQENAVAGSRLESLEADLIKAKGEVQKAEEQVASLEKVLVNKERRIVELETEKGELGERLRDAVEAGKKMEVERDRILGKLKEEEQNREAAERGIEGFLQAKMRANLLEEELKRLLIAAETSDAELKSSRATIDTLELHRRELEIQVDSLKQEKEWLVATQSELKDKMEGLERKLQASQEMLREERGDMEALSEEMANLQLTFKERVIELELAAARVNALSSELVNVKGSATSNEQALQSELEGLRAELRAEQEAVQLARGDRDKLTNEVRELRQSLANKDEEFYFVQEELTRELEAKKEEMQDEKKVNEGLLQDLSALRRRFAALEATVEAERSASLAETEAKLEGLEGAMEGVRRSEKEVMTLRDHLKAREAALTASQMGSLAATEAAEAAHAELRQLQDSIAAEKSSTEEQMRSVLEVHKVETEQLQRSLDAAEAAVAFLTEQLERERGQALQAGSNLANVKEVLNKTNANVAHLTAALMKEQNETRQAQQKAHHQRVQELEKALAELKAKHEAELGTKDKELVSTMERLRQVEQKLKTLQSSLASKETQLETAQAKIADTCSELEETKAAMFNATESVSQLNAQIVRYKEQLTVQNGVVLELEVENSRLKKELSDARNCENSLKVEMEDLEARAGEVVKLKKELDARTAEAAMRREDVAAFQQQLEHMKESWAVAVHSLKEAEEEVVNLKDELAKSGKMLALATEEADRRKEDVARLRAEKQEAGGVIKQEKDSLAEMLEVVRSEKEGLKAEVVRLEKDKCELELEKEQVLVELKRVTDKLKISENELTTVKEDFAARDKNHANVLQVTGSKISILEKEASKLRDEALDLQTELGKKEMMLVSIRKEKEDLEREAGSLVEEVRSLKVALDHKEHELIRAEELTKLLDKRSSELVASRTGLQDAEIEVVRLGSELQVVKESSESKILEMEEAMAALKKQLDASAEAKAHPGISEEVAIAVQTAREAWQQAHEEETRALREHLADAENKVRIIQERMVAAEEGEKRDTVGNASNIGNSPNLEKCAACGEEKVDKVKEELTKSQEQVATVREKLQRAVKKGKGIEQQKVKLEKDLAAMEEEMISLRRKLEGHGNKMNEDLNKEELGIRVASNMELIRELTDERDRWKSKVTDMEGEVAEMMQHLKKTQDESEVLRSRLVEAAEQVRILTGNLEDKDREVQELLQDKLQGQSREQEALQVAHVLKVESIADMKSKIAAADAKKAELELEKVQLEQRIKASEATAEKEVMQAKKAAEEELAQAVAEAKGMAARELQLALSNAEKEAAVERAAAMEKGNKEAEAMTRKVKNLEMTLEAMKGREEQLIHELEKAKHDAEGAEKEVQKLEKELIGKRMQLDESSSQMDALHFEFSRLQQAVAEKTVEVLGANRTVVDMKKQLDEEKRTAAETKQKLAAELSELRKRLKACEAELAQRAELLSTEELRAAELEGIVARLKEEMEGKEASLRQVASGRSKALAKLGATVDKLKEIQQQSEAIVAEAENKLQLKDAELAKLRDECNRLSATAIVQEADVRQMRGELEVLESMNAEVVQLRREVQQLEDEGGDVRDTLRAKEIELGKVKRELEDLVVKAQKLEEEVYRKSAEADELQALLGSTQEDLLTQQQATHDAELEQLKQQVRELTSEAEGLRASVQWRDAEIEELRHESQGLIAEAEDWRSSAERKDAQLQELTQEIQTLLAEAQTVRERHDQKESGAVGMASGVSPGGDLSLSTERKGDMVSRDVAEVVHNPTMTLPPLSRVIPLGNVRKAPGNSSLDFEAIDVDSPPSSSASPRSDGVSDSDLTGLQQFVPITAAYPYLPSSIGSTMNSFDRLSVAVVKLLMNNPGARLLLLVYWLGLHLWMAATLSTVRV